MRFVKHAAVCQLSADDFWRLRLDLQFDHFMAADSSHGASFRLLSSETKADAREGQQVVHQVALITYARSPVPPAYLFLLTTTHFLVYCMKLIWNSL